jgi:Uma2 family endonuclease
MNERAFNQPLKKVGDDFVGSAQKADSIAGKLIPKDTSNRWHNLVASNVAIALGSRLKGTKCDIYVNGMRVKLKNNMSCYPDVIVVSGEPSFADPQGEIRKRQIL